MNQQPAHIRLSGNDEMCHVFEVLSGLLIRPGGSSRRKRLQPKRAVACFMAYHAPRVPFAMFQENRLDALAVSFEIE